MFILWAIEEDRIFQNKALHLSKMKELVFGERESSEFKIVQCSKYRFLFLKI